MTALTIFSAPKPFTDPHIALIQRNAIQSWLHLGPEVDVLLVGEEPGLAEAVTELRGGAASHLRWLPEVQRNPEGTPLVSSIFALARQASASPLLVYLNADILAMPDLLRAAQAAADQAEQFLLIGQRWDLDVTQPLDFSPTAPGTQAGKVNPSWEQRLRQAARQQGRLHPPQGSDYFVFPRNLFADMPDFAIGRAGWDNWMIYQARRQGWYAIDGTPSVMIIHQSHNYRHLPGGQPHYTLPESERNQELAGGVQHMFTILDTDWLLREIAGELRLLRPPLTMLRLLRRLEVQLTRPFDPALIDGRGSAWRRSLARQLRRWRRRLTGDL